MSRQQAIRAKWRDLDLSGVGGTVPMLLILGFFALAIFFVATVIGEARGMAMMCWGVFSSTLFVPAAVYSIKREADRAFLQTQGALESRESS